MQDTVRIILSNMLNKIFDPKVNRTVLYKEMKTDKHAKIQN